MSSRRQTAENRDIRVWAQRNGIELNSRGRIPDEVRTSYWDERGGAPAGDGDGPAERSSGEGGAFADVELERLEGVARATDGAPSGAPGGAVGEGAPFTGGAPEAAPVERTKRRLWERSAGPRAAPKRESLSTLAMFVWGGMAQTAQRAGRGPTSRMLQLQAPVAGMLLDDAVRGTLVDRILQPFARTGKRGEAIWALIGPPILVEAIMRHPERQDVLLPLLAAALEQYADLAGPKIAAAKKRAEKRAQDIGVQGIEELIAFLFTEPAAAPGGGESRAA